MTKPADDIVDRFTAEARSFTRLALVVIVGNEARLMWSDGANLRMRLNGYIEAGGLPIGTIGYVEARNQLECHLKVLDELSEIPFIKAHLTRLLNEIQARWMESQGMNPGQSNVLAV